MIVYEKSKLILATLESISTATAQLSELVTGTLKVGLSHIVGTILFPKVAQVYREKFPGVTIDIVEEGGLVIEKHVERGEVDIGFVVLTNDHLTTKNSKLVYHSIYNDEFVLCVSANHRLSNVKTVSLRDLKEENFIFFSKTWAIHELVVDACKGAGYILKVLFESEQWDLILELVSAELGITVIPRILANKLNDIDIRMIPIKDPHIDWKIGIVIHGSAYQTFALKEFLKTINEVFEIQLDVSSDKV